MSEMMLIYTLLLGIFIISLGFIQYIRSETRKENDENILEIANIIREASYTYLWEQNKVILLIVAVLFGGFYYYFGRITSICFLIGACGSLWSGVVAMYVSLQGNVATVSKAKNGLGEAFKMSFFAGAGASIYLNVLGLICIAVCVFLEGKLLSKSLLGFSIGANVVAIFARLGGGIFTKGADVGADMVGKIEQDLNEDSPKNPAVIADNVGDNVGDCAGMAADLFESYVVTIVSTITILYSHDKSIITLLLHICIMALISCILPVFFLNYKSKSPWKEMSNYFYICSSLFLGSLFAYQYYFAINPLITKCIAIGVGTVFLLLQITSYYTSSEYRPVNLVVEASKYGSGTNIISGLAMGYESVVAPLFVIIAAVLGSYYLNGIFGITLCSIGIAALSPAILTMDILGPISDNAGGISEMAKLSPKVREVTDELDSIGNTTKAVTKGYAICSAIFTILVMFFSYHNELLKALGNNFYFTIDNPLFFCGLLIGGIIPYAFSGMSMLSVGIAAEYVVSIVRKQVANEPRILLGTVKPNYNEVVKFLTRFSIKSMIIPALVPILITVASFIGVNKFIGLNSAFIVITSILLGTTLVGITMSISMITAGGLWDNAKKYVEKQNLKHTDLHKSAVTGDTVGDPFKDTTGPSLNSVVKLVSLVCILLASVDI